MDKRTEAGREFWRAVLLAGGVDRDPAVDARPGTGRRRARGDRPDDDLAAAVRRLADGLAAAAAARWLLAAHAKVLAALSGEQERGDRLRRAGPAGNRCPAR